MDTGIDEFFGVLKDVRRVAVFSAGGLIVLPVAASMGGYSPPWPDGIVMITTLMELVILIVTFQVYFNSPKSAITKVVIAAAISLLLFSLIYLLTYSVFVYAIPNNRTRIVLGCGLSRDALSLLNDRGKIAGLDDCPGEFYSLLKSAQYEADRVYSKLSVSLIRAALDISWLGCFGSLACVCGAFITFQRRRRIGRN
jgi:hypothetical protein